MNPRLLAFPGGRWIGWGIALAIILPLAWEACQRHQPYNGFRLDDASVPITDIDTGGPGRDDIPALTDPAVVPAAAADYLRDSDRIIGLQAGGHTRAYPLRILTWHEVVNDRLGGRAVVVTYCPLCGTGVAFAGHLNGERLEFGVSGLLYRANLLMYDRGKRSLWSQMGGRAISGPHRGMELERLPIEHATWGAWRRRHPRTDVLSLATGHRRDYDRDPYRDYAASVHAPAGSGDDQLPAKARVIGIEIGGQARAYPLATLALNAPEGEVRDHLAGTDIRITYSAIDYSATATDARGRVLPMMLAYWFAWRDLHPDTQVHAPADTPGVD